MDQFNEIELLQALAKDLPWKLKDSRVTEIVEAVGICYMFPIFQFLCYFLLFRRCLGCSDCVVSDHLWQIDSNTDGLVDFTEFVAATLHVHQMQEHDNEKWQQLSQAAFEKFDVDKDGFITPEELKLVSLAGIKI